MTVFETSSKTATYPVRANPSVQYIHIYIYVERERGREREREREPGALGDQAQEPYGPGPIYTLVYIYIYIYMFEWGGGGAKHYTTVRIICARRELTFSTQCPNMEVSMNKWLKMIKHIKHDKRSRPEIFKVIEHTYENKKKTMGRGAFGEN